MAVVGLDDDLATDAETVELVLEWLAEKGVVGVMVFRDDDGWRLAGTSFPSLPRILRKMATRVDDYLDGKPVH